ncbi:MAG TPA: SAM-dependent methyltransferase [Steroidobacteraceae bacterium]|nr:SAM-dependent methyltransferase [Steroidobacteraceae bacterium]
MTSDASVTTLPALSDDERAHVARVAETIRTFIREQGGTIGFDAFMRLALYAPGLGYYSAGATKLGVAGDFVTAPEVSSLFSRCLARQVADVLDHTGGDVLELGAGSGRMAADILTELAALDRLPANYRILEVSADLAERQRARIAALPPDLARRVSWLDAWPDRPMRGVVLANEVLDAMPVERFVLRGRDGGIAVHALGVGLDGDEFAWREISPSPEVLNAVADVVEALPAPLPDGYVSELCMAFQPWMAGLAAQLEAGVALLIDYGLPRSQLYHPDRARGTLRCHFRHRAHDDPFVNVGLQDITAWVDFTRVAEAADSAGLEVLGFATQAAFLIGAGIESLLAAEMAGVADDTRGRAVLAGEARKLLLPGEMGEVFKVVALGRHFDAPLAGFSTQDLRGSL